MGRPARHPRRDRRADPDPRRPGPALSTTPGPPATPGLPEGTRPSPNIWHHTDTYEVENHAFDPDGLVEAAIERLGGWAGRDVLDLGCGTGFHLGRLARTAASVTGVEPHPDLRAIATRRTRRTAGVTVLGGTAQALPLPDASIDVVHARWAYFFGPGCEPGLAELARVARPGAAAYVIDNDASRSTFGAWFARGFPEHPAPEVKREFWAAHGWRREPVLTRWSFDSPADLEAVVRIELPGPAAEQALAEHRAAGGGTEVEYAVDVWWRRF
ncbi:SAM-dependent methyltransferase [Nocardioides marinisabuli]|uniref:SAM-dependent methyltransferase n=1 Tax=Nocardioides marinisabuli TaxID=419476 RepID=A0A7Y9EZ12_9ACTN|nr:class I SAM-dependent methyltransferase [Nocardioides marinisabuli]NYD56595.1 SAM-dependent methyltransferase [Nocardioides marinisabuli]